MKRLKHILTSFGSLSLLSLLAASPVSAQTVKWSGVCVGGANDDVATIQGLECLVANVFIVFISVLGLSAFVMFVIASFRWLLSGGNTKGTESARNTFTFAVVGIVTALSAFIILNLMASFTGIPTIVEFRIPTSI